MPTLLQNPILHGQDSMEATFAIKSSKVAFIISDVIINPAPSISCKGGTAPPNN